MDYLTLTFDPAIRPDGLHSLNSEYVETFWLPVLGPGAICLLRRFGRLHEPIASQGARPQTTIPVGDLAHMVGLKGQLTQNSKLGKVIDRLVWYRFIERTGDRALTISPYMPTLRPKQIDTKLPLSLQALHLVYTAA